MVVKKQLTVWALLGLSMVTVPLGAAEAPVARSDKDEKEAHAQEQVEGKEIAASIESIPEKIPFVIPENQQLKKDGKSVEEFLDAEWQDCFSHESFKEIVATALKEEKAAVIARVVTKMPDNSCAVHYFDIEQLRNYFRTQGNKLCNPFNKQPIKSLSYCVYIPGFKQLEVIYLESLDSAHFIAMQQIEEAAQLKMAERLEERGQEHYKACRAAYKHWSEHATLLWVKQRAHYNRAIYLQNGFGGEKDVAKAREIFESLAAAHAGEVTVRAHYQLAQGFYTGVDKEQWPRVDKEALKYAILAIRSPHNNDLTLTHRAQVYAIASEILMQPVYSSSSEARHVYDYAKQALTLAEEINDKTLQAQAHARLALCYYNEPLFGEIEYGEDEGRYERAWYHGTQALPYSDSVKSIHGFIDMCAEMLYFALGNDGDVKKALEYMKQRPYTPEYFTTLVCHYDYYHASKKEPAKKQQAIRTLQEFIDTHESEENLKIPYYTQCALLGEMYQHESEHARDQAYLHITTDPERSRDYDRLADDLNKKADKIFDIILKMPQEYHSSYAWALTNLVLARRELQAPYKDYEKASGYLLKIYNERREFPLLVSNARALILDIEDKVTTDFALDLEKDDGLHVKDPRYYEKQFKCAMYDFNTITIAADGLEEFITSIRSQFKLVATKAPKASLLKMQAEQALKVIDEQQALIQQVRAANERTDEGSAAKRGALARLAELPGKSIQEYCKIWLKNEGAERAGLSLDASLDAPRGDSLPMPADADSAAMDVRSDDRRGKKRKPEHVFVDPRGDKEARSNGAGSASA